MRRSTILFTICFCLGSNFSTRAENWPEFRGPTGQGHYTGKALPTEWSTTKNVAWQKSIPGKGWSSPIILNGRIYLTSAVPIDDSKNVSLKAICLEATDGKVRWQTELFEQDGAKSPAIHGKNSHASPSPITDGKRLYVHFGHEGTGCLDLDGKILWQNTEHRYSPVHGNGGSPILVENRLVYSTDGSNKQLLIALETSNGKTVWTTDRQSTAVKKFSFGTPLAIVVDGKTQIISPASDVVMACDPADGKELWQVKYTGYSVIPRPVFGHGLVFLSSGYDSPSIFAIRVDGSGDVTKSHLAWTVKKGAPHTPSLLLVGDELYAVSDAGIASCLEAETGKEIWRERVPGNYSASPFYSDGKIFLHNEAGLTTVLKAGKQFEVLASNDLKERTLASAAIADGAIYLRTETQLYRIQTK